MDLVFPTKDDYRNNRTRPVLRFLSHVLALRWNQRPPSLHPVADPLPSNLSRGRLLLYLGSGQLLLLLHSGLGLMFPHLGQGRLLRRRATNWFPWALTVVLPIALVRITMNPLPPTMVCRKCRRDLPKSYSGLVYRLRERSRSTSTVR